MSIFKIINITNQLGKRDSNYNSTLNVEYVDNMEKKLINVKPNKIVYLTVPTLPLSLHSMRMKKWVVIKEITQFELNNIMSLDKTVKKPVKKPVKKHEIKEEKSVTKVVVKKTENKTNSKKKYKTNDVE